MWTSITAASISHRSAASIAPSPIVAWSPGPTTACPTYSAPRPAASETDSLCAVQSVAVIGAALDLGQGRRGVDMGPSAIRYAGLAERLRALGGDHSVAIGSLGGLASVHGPGGVIWIDAHGDLNRPDTTPSGNVHGMVLAAALGLAGPGFESDDWPLPSVDRRRVALVGTRSLDDGERELVGEQGIRVWTMSHIDQLGVERVMREALEHVSGPNFVHVSLDMDVLDPDVAPGVGTAVRGGLTYREAHLALELVADANVMSSLDVVEVNPVLDVANATATLAVDLVASALGAKIL